MPNPKKERAMCLNCGKPVKWGEAKYCSNRCQADFQYRQYIANWKRGNETGLIAQEFVSRHLRRFLIEKYGERCAECGWQKRNRLTGQVPLTIHHIDGDWANNREENLVLLCPNCHALTDTFQNLNRGKGRTYRRKYEQRKNS